MTLSQSQTVTGSSSWNMTKESDISQTPYHTSAILWVTSKWNAANTRTVQMALHQLISYLSTDRVTFSFDICRTQAVTPWQYVTTILWLVRYVNNVTRPPDQNVTCCQCVLIHTCWWVDCLPGRTLCGCTLPVCSQMTGSHQCRDLPWHGPVATTWGDLTTTNKQRSLLTPFI